MDFNISLAPEAKLVIEHLEKAGYEAYLVGGAVRDALLGKKSHDSDICTNAYPEEMQKVFEGFRCIETGIKHGTLTVLTEFGAVEITTYRVDGVYSDHRRPDAVSFTRSLTEDLARRDFTINAMAWNPKIGLADPFGGAEDLKNNIIRAVGDPVLRFTEDALRIMRALRFAARLRSQIEETTKKAIFSLKKDLKYVAKERIREELLKTLVTDGAVEILLSYAEVFCEIIPELAACHACVQNNPHHLYTVYEHMVRAVGMAPKDADIRMAVLLHDVAKPLKKTTDEKGIDHFRGHNQKSAEIAEKILKDLRFSHASTVRIVAWIDNHDNFRSYSETILRRRVQKIGEENMEGMLWVCRSDVLAQSDLGREEKLAVLDAFAEGFKKMQSEKPPYRLQDLAIGGKALIAMGLKGPVIGKILDVLLDEVIDNKLSNDEDTLMARVKEMIASEGNKA